MAETCSTRAPLIVIVVPFIDWGPLLERCVANCLALADAHFLLCLVTGSAAQVPVRWASDPRVSVIESAAEGIAHKRNLAIRAYPDAAFYACIDSDAWPQAGWLAAARRVFAQDPEIWLVGGPNLSPENLTPARATVANALLSPLVSGPKRYTKQLSESRDAVDLPACNLLLRRALIDAIGGFDESFEVGEDSLMCQQALQRGKRIRFDRDVRVFHQPRALGRPFLRQRVVSGYGIPPLLGRCWRTMSLASICAELSPALALIWFACGWLGGRLFPAWLFLWSTVVGVYLLLLGIETLRVCRDPRLWPGTAAALLVGNLAPGLGILYRLAGGRLAISRIYRNSEGAPEPYSPVC